MLSLKRPRLSDGASNGEASLLFLDVIGLVAAAGYAADVSQCRELHRLARTVSRLGDAADKIGRSLESQRVGRAALATAREDFFHPGWGVVHGTTQLMRAVVLNNLSRVLQLVQRGVPLELRDFTWGETALHLAAGEGHDHIVSALLDGKYPGSGTPVDVLARIPGAGGGGWSPLFLACRDGRDSVVSLLLARGADAGLRSAHGDTAAHWAVDGDKSGAITILCASPGAAAFLALRDRNGFTPLDRAIINGSDACEAVLRVHGEGL